MPRESIPAISNCVAASLSRTYLGECIFVRKQYRQYRARTQQVLHLECVQIGVVGRFEVVKHKVDSIRRCADENNFEDGVVERFGLVEGP
jgi:hypothetical protein